MNTLFRACYIIGSVSFIWQGEWVALCWCVTAALQFERAESLS
jgi:hypothetical protein